MALSLNYSRLNFSDLCLFCEILRFVYFAQALLLCQLVQYEVFARVAGSWRAAVIYVKAWKKMQHFACCAALAAVLFTTLIAIFFVLNLKIWDFAHPPRLGLYSIWASCSYKIVLIKKCRQNLKTLRLVQYQLKVWVTLPKKLLA